MERLEAKQEQLDQTKAEELDLQKPPSDYLKSLQPLGMVDKEKVRKSRLLVIAAFNHRKTAYLLVTTTCRLFSHGR